MNFRKNCSSTALLLLLSFAFDPSPSLALELAHPASTCTVTLSPFKKWNTPKVDELLKKLFDTETINEYTNFATLSRDPKIKLKKVKWGLYEVSKDEAVIGYLKVPSEVFEYMFHLGPDHEVIAAEERPVPIAGIIDRSEATYSIDHSLGYNVTSEAKKVMYADNDALFVPLVSDIKRGVNHEDLEKLLLLDLITGELDRHADNILVKADGTITAIDHDLSFPCVPLMSDQNHWKNLIGERVIPEKLKEPILALINDHFFEVLEKQFHIRGYALITAKVRINALVSLLKEKEITYKQLLKRLDAIFQEYREKNPYVLIASLHFSLQTQSIS